MQIVLVPELPPSRGNENIVTAMDVFSCFLIVYLTSDQDANSVATFVIFILNKQAYLATTLISDKGSAFTSHVIREEAGILEITLKHAQTTGMLEQSHASTKQALKIQTGE